METILLLKAALLGVIEGLTEFIPVSSTGHLILIENLLGFEGPKGKIFEIIIQLGAILAVCWVYKEKILAVMIGLPNEKKAQRFTFNILLAFMPAVVVGVLAHDFIKNVLFNPWVVSVALVVGGFAILAIEYFKPAPRHTEVEWLPYRTALGVGFCQVFAMVPGVSRSGATIMGSLLMSVERKAAAEFSFFLAIPTMLGATAYDVYKNYGNLDSQNTLIIVIGFVMAFTAALMVVRALIEFVGKYGFTPFAWYRIVVGTSMLVMLSEQSYGFL